MKKTVYYITSFAIIPILTMLFFLLDARNLIEKTTYVLYALILCVSAVIGNLTPTRKNFDYIISAIMILSLFSTIFVVGYLDKCDLEARFHFDRAFEAVSQPLSLQMYFMLGIITFFASFKRIRIASKIQSR